MQSVIVQSGTQQPTIFISTMPAVVIWRRGLEHLPERRGLNAPALAAHAEAQEQELFMKRQNQPGGFYLLDFLALTAACGPACSGDGMHYNSAANRAALHIMLNVFSGRQEA